MKLIMVDIERPASASSTSSRSKRDDWYELIPQQVELSSPSAGKRKTSNSSPQHPSKEARTLSISDFSTLDHDAIASDGDVFSPAPDYLNGGNVGMRRTHYTDDNDNHLEPNDNLKDGSLELSDSSDSIQKPDCHGFFSAVELHQQSTEQYPFVDDEEFISSSEIDIPLPTSDDEGIVNVHQTVKEVASEPLKTGALQQAISNISLDFVSGNLSASVSKLPLDSSFSSVTSHDNGSTTSSTNSSPRRIPKGKSKSVSSKNKDNKRKLLNGYTASSEKSSSLLNSKLEKISKSGKSSDQEKNSIAGNLSGILNKQSCESSLSNEGQLKSPKDNKTESKEIYASNILPQAAVDIEDPHQPFQRELHEVSADLDNETISFPSEKNAVSMLSDSVALIDKKPITTSTPYVQSDKQTMRMKSKQASEKIKSVKKSTTKSPRSSLESSSSSVTSEGKKIKVRSQSPKQIRKAADLSSAGASSIESKKVSSRSQSPKVASRSHSPKVASRSQSPKVNSRSQSPKVNSRSQSPKYVPKHSTSFRERSSSPKQISKTSSSKPSSRSTSVDIKQSVSPKRGSKKPKPKNVLSGKSSVLSQSSKSDSSVTPNSKDSSRSSGASNQSTSVLSLNNSSNQMSEDSLGSTKNQDSNEFTRGSNIQLPLNLDTLKPEIEKVLEQNVQPGSKTSSVTSSIKFGTDSSQSAPESDSGKSDSKTATPDLKPASSYIQYPSDLQSDNLSRSAIQKESDLEDSSNTDGQFHLRDSRKQLSRENLSLNVYSQREALSRKVAELLAENVSNKDLLKSAGNSENSSKAGTPDSIEEDQKERAMRMQFMQENVHGQEQEKSLSGSISSNYHDALGDNGQAQVHRSQSPQSDTSTSSSVRAIIDRVMTKGSEVSIDPRFTQRSSPVGSVASEPSVSATSRLRQSHNRSKESSGYSAIDRSRLHSSSPGGRGSTSSLIWDSFTGPPPPSHAQVSSTMSSQTPSMGMTQTSQEAKSDSLSLTAEWQARRSSQIPPSASNVSARSSDSLARRVQKLLATTAYLDGDTRKIPQEIPGRARIDDQIEAEGFSLSRSLSPHLANRQKLLSEHGRSVSTDDLTRATHPQHYSHNNQMQHPDMRGSTEGVPNEGHSALYGPDISQDIGSYPSFEQGGPDGMSSMLAGGRAPSRVSSISISPRMSPHPMSRQASVESHENLEGLVHQVRMILGADAPQERVDRIIKAALLEEGRQSAELDQYYSTQNLSEYPLSDHLSRSHYGSDPHLAQNRSTEYQQYSPGGPQGTHPNLRNIAAISQARNLISNQMQRAAQNQFDHSVDIRGMPTDYDRHTPLQHRSSPQVPPMRMMDDWQRREAWLEQAEKAAQSDRLAYGILPERTSPLSNSRSPSRTSSSMASSPDRFFGLSPQQSPKKPYSRDSDPFFDYGHIPGSHPRLSRPWGRQFQTIAAMEMSKQYSHRDADWSDPYHYHHNSSRPGSVHEVPSRHAHSFDLPHRPLSAGNHGTSAFHSVPKAHVLSRRVNPRYHTVSGVNPNELMRHASPSYPARVPDRNTAYGTPVYEHLHPYKPPGSSEVMYTYPYGNEGVNVSSPAHTETTMESTHPGSDDAQPPHFPRHVFGDRQEVHEKFSPVGIYSNNQITTSGSKSHRSPPAAAKGLERHARPLAWDVPKDTNTSDKEQYSPPGHRMKKVGGVTTWKEMSLSKSSSEGEDKSEEEGERFSRKTQEHQQEGHQYRDVSGGRKSRREESPHKPNTFFVDYNDPDAIDPTRRVLQDPDHEDTMEAEMDRIRNNLERSRSGRQTDTRPVYQSPPFHRKVGGSSNGSALPGSYSRQVLQQVIQQENSSDNREYVQAWDEYQRSKIKEKKELDQHQMNRLATLIQNPVQYYSTKSSGSSIIGEISDDASSISSTGSQPRRRKKWRKDAKFTPKQQSPDEADRNIAEDLKHKILEEEKDESNSSSSDEAKPENIERLHPSNENTKTATSPSDNKYDDILKETTLSDLSVDSEKLYRMLGPKGVEKLSTKLSKLQQRIEIQKEHHKRRTTGKKLPLAVIGPTSSSESEVSNIMSTDSSLYSSELHRVSEGHERVSRKPLRTHIDRFHRMPERSSSVESEPMYRSRGYRKDFEDDSTDGPPSDLTSDALGACSCKPPTKARRSQSLHDKTARSKGQDLRKREASPGDNGLSESDDQIFHKPSRPAPRAREKTRDSAESIVSNRSMKGTSFTVDVGHKHDASDAARRRKDKSRDKENQRELRGKDKEPGAKPKTRSSKTGEKLKKSKIYTPESPDDEKKKEIPNPPPKPVERPVGWFQPLSNKMSWVQEAEKKDAEKKDPEKSGEPPDALAKVSLKDAFEVHKLSFISKSKERVRKVKLAAEERQIQEHYEKERLKMFQEDKPKQANPHAHPLSEQLHSPKRRTITRKEMKAQTERVYSNLPEVKKKIEGQKRCQANQTNRLRAQLYKKKLMERLKGRPWTGPTL